MKRTLPLLALLASCTDQPATSEIEEAIYINDGYEKPECPTDECGLNTGSMGEVFWHELHMGKTITNTSGVGYVGITGKPLPAASVDVKDNRLVVVDEDGEEVTGMDIVGTYLILRLDGVRYWLKVVARHNEAKYWAYQPAPFGAWEFTVETYTMMWKLEGQSDHYLQDFCKIEATHVENVVKTDVVVFNGDRYEPSTKEITLTSDPQWLNFACLGSGPAKMYFSRHTTASDDPAHPTTLSERKALINAWTGNYCGDGRSFTKTGEPLRFRDDRGFFDEESPWGWSVEFNELGFNEDRISSYDAVWSGSGATCIDTPRLRLSGNKLDLTILNRIKNHCEGVGKPPPGPCTTKKNQVLTNWDTSRTHILTGNPVGS